jgi:hypothetical protein
MSQPLKVDKSGPFWKRVYTLEEPWEMSLDYEGKTYLCTLPKGWKFDGATFGWLIGLRKEASMEPAAKHDYLYENRSRVFCQIKGTKSFSWITVTKEYADKCYLRETGDHGVNIKSWQRWLIKIAFATVGEIYWRT